MTAVTDGDRPIIPAWLSNVLLPLSWVYSVGLAIYLLPYKLGFRFQHKLKCRVVCVGNLTFGGTGKSPMVRAICEEIVKRDVKAAILSRGHGGLLSPVGAIVSDGTCRNLDTIDCGDEPALLADSLPGVPVAIGKHREKIGRVLVERFAPDIVVLDDGMQYWQLHRDADIVLVNAEKPLGMGRVLPAGDLREPIKGIRRASAVVITGAEAVDAESLKQLEYDLYQLAPQAEIFVSRRLPAAIIDLETREHVSMEELSGKPVVAVSGIARPWSFEATLSSCGAEIKEKLRFGDHCSYKHGEPATIADAVKRSGAEFVVTTAKDAVKLGKLPVRTFVLDIRIEVENMDRLVDIVLGRIEGSNED